MPHRLHTLTLPRAILLACVAIGLALSPGCRSEPPAAPPPPPSPAAAPEIPTATTRCTPERAAELIEGIALTTPDDACRVFLPLDPEPGDLEVRVSAAGADDLAAIEWTANGQRLFADRGQVTITTASENRVAGSFTAEASAGPRVERVEGTFDIALHTP